MIFKCPGNYTPPYMPEHFVWWDTIEAKDVDELEQQLCSATNERTMQEYLGLRPLLLIQHLGGGHGRWVLPQKSLGSEFRTDFVVGHKHSFGYEWEVIEIESPTAKPFTKSGDFSRELTHAIRQIVDWRAWLKRNQNYAARRKEEQGLGLLDIDSNVPGVIIIGRKSEIDEGTNDRRRQLVQDSNITIHSYDWLVREARGRVEALSFHRNGTLNEYFSRPRNPPTN